MDRPAISKADLARALPDLECPVHCSALSDPLTIRRDQHGIPHIKACSVHDAFFGQGFATAQDRLWHMDYDRMRAYGRLAEWMGAASVADDIRMRRFQLQASAEADFAALSSTARVMFEAYAAGVNAYIDSAENLPIEYTLLGIETSCWQAWDSLAVFKVRHILMGVFEEKLWRAHLLQQIGPQRTAALYPGYQAGHLLIIPPGDRFAGEVNSGLEELRRGLRTLSDEASASNSWALAGERSATGGPLLAGDSHRGLDTPNVYYQNHICCPDFDAIGLSFPGCPGFPHFGHNAAVAWCVTHAGTDYQDLFVERFKKGDPTQYEFKGLWRAADVRRERVLVRDGESVDLTLARTHHGPIISGDPNQGRGIAFRYSATADANLGFEAFLGMLHARSTEELDEAMRLWVDPCNNFVFVDVHGNIAYLNRGKVPVRAEANAWLPVPGWSGDHEWQGFVPFEKLVRCRNPAQGYIVTANNRISADDYYIALDFAPEYRARRVTTRLQGLRQASVEDMASVHADRISIPARAYVRLLQDLPTQDPLAAQALATLRDWDGSMASDHVAPTVYTAFRRELNRRLLNHLLGPLAEEIYTKADRGAQKLALRLAATFVRAAQQDDVHLLPPDSKWSDVLVKAFHAGVESLKRDLGPDLEAWKWGDVHKTQHTHPLAVSHPELGRLLNPPSFAMSGDGDTPLAAGQAVDGSYAVSYASVARYVFDPSDWDNSRWIVPLGSSGHPGSCHYADQASRWAEVGLIPMLYRWSSIETQAETTQLLQPGG